MKVSHINPWFLIPPHSISHPEKLYNLSIDMSENGWNYKLSPLIGYHWLNNMIQLLSGSHRVIAARNARLFNIPVIVYDYETIEKAWGNLDKWKEIMNV